MTFYRCLHVHTEAHDLGGITLLPLSGSLHSKINVACPPFSKYSRSSLYTPEETPAHLRLVACSPSLSTTNTSSRNNLEPSSLVIQI
mmetsp:Transcript_1409/g.1700  ORF Transcript_1409/g.1700 Transcript_1409/m.1700 type:complete len:87 (-) Transcript_1409:46-306(-)